jgi:hypothetical protein
MVLIESILYERYSLNMVVLNRLVTLSLRGLAQVFSLHGRANVIESRFGEWIRQVG